MKIRTYSPFLYSPDELLGGASPDAPVETAAPVETSGQGEPSQAMYQEYLAAVPEALRPQVEPAFQKWDAAVTQKFQGHADAMKVWEPYAELGIQDIDPTDMGHLKAFYEVASNPEAFKKWVKSAYDSLHGQSQTEVTTDPAAAADPEYLTADQAREVFQQQQAERDQQAEVQRITDGIAGEMQDTFAALKAKHGDFDVDLVAFLANRDHGDAPTVKESLEAGHAAMLKMFGKVESDALDTKLKQPKAAVTAGSAHSAPIAAASLGEAGERLKARLNAANSA